MKSRSERKIWTSVVAHFLWRFLVKLTGETGSTMIWLLFLPLHESVRNETHIHQANVELQLLFTDHHRKSSSDMLSGVYNWMRVPIIQEREEDERFRSLLVNLSKYKGRAKLNSRFVLYRTSRFMLQGIDQRSITNIDWKVTTLSRIGH